MDLFALTASLSLDSSQYEQGINDARDTAQNFANGFGGGKGDKLIVNAFKAAGNAAWQFAKDVVNTGMEVDKQYSAVQAVLGEAEGTVENLYRLKQFGMDQARESIFTVQETGEAYYYMGMAGWKTEQMLAGLPGIMALAAASGENLGRTSDIVTDTLTAFGLGAGQAAHFADILAVTATNTNTDVSRMGETFKYMSTVAGAMGYSIEDAALSIGLIANQGIKGSQAGTALRNIWTRLSTDAGASSKSLGALGMLTEKLGVSFYDSAGKARPWIDILTESREAWKTMDPSHANEVAAAFGSFAAEGQDAAQVMADFSSDLDTWTTQWNGLTTDVERENFAAQLAPQFEALGISMRDSNGKLREFSQIAGEARIKLGGLNDEESISIANKIGTLRGMTAWLALMNATEEDFQQVSESVNNAAGAAQKMADVRLDNLWGDTVLFNSALNVLEDTLFDVVKGPMREIVQYGTSALNRITDAINENGITGGLEQLGVEIENIGKNEGFIKLAKSIGTSLAPVVGSLLTTLEGPLAQTAMTLGSTFGAAFMEGLSGSKGTGPISTVIFGLFGNVLKGLSINSGGGILGMLAGGMTNLIWGGLDGGSGFLKSPLKPMPTGIKASTSFGGATGGGAQTVRTGQGEAGRTKIPVEPVVEDTGGLASQLATAGAEAGAEIASEIGSEVSSTDSSGLASALGSAGSSAGSQITSTIQGMLSAASFAIHVAAQVSGLPTGATGVEKHAKSMYGGTILHGATVFGINGKGQPMVGGETGPEAIVGVGSLNSMIQSSVAAAMSSVVDRLEGAFAAQPTTDLQVVLDTGALVGGITNKMNRALGATAVRRGAGRA